ncbi:hypothetical protein U9M48_007560 [Paspalum notatum var. saurae]|uniref:Protein kinase domain-containing protein n=1 Tax=Paspalum notatum var. saurae TaxID=547442 RepID=A0AAQ3Q0C2_PASNO
MVTVKKFIRNVKENFGKELIVHREINHKNVVRLIGYCAEENALMLVTEYIANGNLGDALHNDNRPIPLDVRLGIAIECAEALAYMHSHMYTQVIHGDIKPENILLDGNFHAKLSDFGISRLANTDKTLYTNNVVGSIGYMDPLFTSDGRLTVKGDVYSFGVVLLELISRKKATTVVHSVNIVYAFANALASGIRGVREMFDAEIASKDNMWLLEGVAKLAGECLAMERDKRPDMIDVAERIRVLWKASHRDPGWQRVPLFSWARKSQPAHVVTVPAKILPSVPCRQFSLAEMEAATNNFGTILVNQGALYRAYLGKIDRAATEVVVKLADNIDEFYRLIEMMSNLHHGHLVPLIGYCRENEMMLLVFKYMVGGNLRDHLYGTQKPPLNWKQRIETCIGVARGLCYLHEKKLIHGDVNSSNILLNEKWVSQITNPPKITNPPLSSSCNTMNTFTLSLDLGTFTEKSDVYSLGVVLLEVLCARPAYDRKLPDEQTLLVEWALLCKEVGSLDYIVDPYLEGKISPRCLNKFLLTAEKCLAPKGIDRPSMGDVLSDLECSLQLQDKSDNYLFSNQISTSRSRASPQPAPTRPLPAAAARPPDRAPQLAMAARWSPSCATAVAPVHRGRAGRSPQPRALLAPRRHALPLAVAAPPPPPPPPRLSQSRALLAARS